MNDSILIRILAALCALLFMLLVPIDSKAQYEVSTLEHSNDRPGLDYNSFELDTGYGHCEFRCKNEKRCRAWTYVRPGIQGARGRCWLKEGLPGSVSNDCCTSGVVRRTVESFTDRPGSDYRNFAIASASSDHIKQCRVACEGDGRCKAWTFVQKGLQGPEAMCWLKDNVPPAYPNNCCTSGVPQRLP